MPTMWRHVFSEIGKFIGYIDYIHPSVRIIPVNFPTAQHIVFMLMVRLVGIGIRCTAFEQKPPFSLVGQIVKQGEHQRALSDAIFASSDIKNRGSHVTAPRLRRQEY